MSKKVTQADFIARARAAHGDLYDYSRAVYAGKKESVIIGCPEHGFFEQTAGSHWAGNHCRKCKYATLSAAQTLTNADFIARARAAHGDRYDYSRAMYAKALGKVAIGCPEHGFFEQKAGNHLHGQGCPKCGRLRTANARTLTNADFIARARAIHGDYYDYSRLAYKANRYTIVIGCPEHGFFEQAASSHTQGIGCPKCGRERTNEANKISWIQRAGGHTSTLYFLRVFNEAESFYKVGITYHSVRHRYARKSGLPGYKYEIMAQHQSANAGAVYDWEQSILSSFAHLRYRPKNNFGGETECFFSCEEILDIFPL